MISGNAIKAPAGIAVASLVALLLAACGGGGDSGTAAAPVQSPPPSNPTPPSNPPSNPTPPANSSPVISGSPGTSVTAGSAYSFTPTASDADNDSLTFTIDNMPSWATFSAANGKLSGTPTAANVGTTSNIKISVSDGKATVALATFSITVSAATTVTGSVTLDWSAPMDNTDGSALTDLTGYKITYGTSAASLNKTISVTNPSVNSYVVDNLAAGSWYFSVAAVNATGVESIPTNPVSATIQ